MISEETVEALPESLKLAVKHAISTLAQADLAVAEISRRTFDLSIGDKDEDSLNLANRIKEHRLITQQLEELHNLGIKYGEEQ